MNNAVMILCMHSMEDLDKLLQVILFVMTRLLLEFNLQCHDNAVDHYY